MPRATFDVNVLISGLISSQGVAARLLALARDGAFALQLSPHQYTPKNKLVVRQALITG